MFSNIGAYVIYPQQRYNRDDYTEDGVISNTASAYFLTGNADLSQEVSFLVNDNTLVLRDSTPTNLLSQD
jgi:hypothetical protein